MEIAIWGSTVSSAVATQVLEDRIHNAAAITINSNAGAFVEIAGGPAIANAITQAQISSTIGEPLVIRKAASSGAAATAADLFMVNQGGGPLLMGTTLGVGDRLWIRSASANSVSSGYITVNFLG